jgi:hypothetical protein
MRIPITIIGDVIGEVENFKYFGSILLMGGSFGMDVKHRIKYGWVKWKEALSVLCDKIIPRRKVKFYSSVVRPTMLYGSE